MVIEFLHGLFDFTVSAGGQVVVVREVPTI